MASFVSCQKAVVLGRKDIWINFSEENLESQPILFVKYKIHIQTCVPWKVVPLLFIWPYHSFQDSTKSLNEDLMDILSEQWTEKCLKYISKTEFHVWLRSARLPVVTMRDLCLHRTEHWFMKNLTKTLSQTIKPLQLSNYTLPEQKRTMKNYLLLSQEWQAIKQYPSV